MWEGSFSEQPSLYFLISSTFGEKLLSSFIHHTYCREGFEPLSRRSMGWKRMGFLLMFNRWSASVFVPCFSSFFKPASSHSAFQSAVCAISSLPPTPYPHCIYYCLLTITMRDGVRDDDRWWIKCLSLAPGYLQLKLERLWTWQQRAHGGLPEESDHRTKRHRGEDHGRKGNQSDSNTEKGTILRC